jgi:sporulation protein YlmC with PRC-barrel domain
MRSLLLGAAAALAFSSAAMAQAANDSDATTAPAATTNAPASTAGATPTFVQKQGIGQLRAPKLVGVSVYDKNNKNVGKIDDLILDKSGKIEAVVVGVGGFLGIGRKDVALPYDAIHWQTEQRTVATNGPAPANNMGSTTATKGEAAQPAQRTVDPAQTEAYNGYPDRAVIDFTQDQLKNAPEFKYASETMNSDGTTAPRP